jgi:hypothetical protein
MGSAMVPMLCLPFLVGIGTPASDGAAKEAEE